MKCNSAKVDTYFHNINVTTAVIQISNKCYTCNCKQYLVFITEPK